MCNSRIASHCLVYWMEEDSVTVVKRRQVIGENEEVGEERSVKWGRKSYKAKIAALGKCGYTEI